MCGIAGIVTRDGQPPEEAALKRMAEALAHRGPDGRGHYLSGGVGMVHTRLAVVDLETGDQPLYAQAGEEGWVALVANGEIYNDLDLRARFGESDFITRSDCEPPLHLYLRHADAFAGHLRGMYAIALHDRRQGSDGGGRVLLARDPFGIKPLYYAETDQGLAFASEIQALVAAGLVEPNLRASARDELLQLGFSTGGETLFAGVHRVLPGETLVVEDGRIVERRHIAALPAEGHDSIAETAALDALDRCLEDSVGAHQRADVPYGMFLSGGIDSAALLAMMGRLNDRPVVAFTAAFPGADVHDERADARAAAAATGAEHIEVEMGEDDFWRLLPEIAACVDDPTADYALIPSYRLAAAAQEAGLKVVLTGEGGDELFGGYGRYRRALRWRMLGGRRMRPRGVFDGLGVLRDGKGWRDGITAAETEVAGLALTPLQRMQAVDCRDWLPNDLLTKLDRTLMAHGVEGRVPFIDPGLAAFAFRLPDALKVRRNLGKRLLRRWLETGLPAARPFARKRGFTVPVAAWIAGRGKALGPLVAAQPGIEEACRPGTVQRIFAEAGSERAGDAAWSLLFYALWHRRHVLCRPPAGNVMDTLAEA